MISTYLRSREFRAQLWPFIAICALAFWQGGLTFYAVVVIPVANSILLGGEQGFVTQEVTTWMNYIGVLAVVILVAYASVLRSRVFWVTCAILAGTLVGLFLVHNRMDALLDRASQSIIDRERFELLHDVYLTVISVQWCAGLVASWLILQGRQS